MELREEIKSIMADSLNLSVEQLADDLDIRKLEKDSIDVFEMICELEDHYNITISNEYFKAFVVVKNAVDEIERLIKSK
jgi:acyl carrier protein